MSPATSVERRTILWRITPVPQGIGGLLKSWNSGSRAAEPQTREVPRVPSRTPRFGEPYGLFCGHLKNSGTLRLSCRPRTRKRQRASRR